MSSIQRCKPLSKVPKCKGSLSLPRIPHLPDFSTLEWPGAQSSDIFFSIYIHFLSDLIQSRDFKYHLYADNLQIYNLSLELSPQLQTHISNCLFDIFTSMSEKTPQTYYFENHGLAPFCCSCRWTLVSKW